jgi:DNA-binding protein H-NS
MKKPKTGTISAEAGRKVILAFMDLGVIKVLEEKAAGFRKTRAKPKSTHRSKKDRKLTWSGRGSMPRWMREEMKSLKLKPSAFLL